MTSPSPMLDFGFSHDHDKAGRDNWLTPPEIICALGEFDLDPCSPIDRPWDTAKKHYTILDNGLDQEWKGRVWLNPPYGDKTPQWMERLAHHGDGIALVFARTDTGTFFPWVWEHAAGLLFLRGRLRFYTKDGRKGGTAGAPSVLIAFGRGNAKALASCGLVGHFIANAQ